MAEPTPTSWCGRDHKPRVFAKHDPIICYDKPAAAVVSKQEYDVCLNPNLKKNKFINSLSIRAG